MAALALAFTAHIVSWMALGRDSLETHVADTIGLALERGMQASQSNGGYCAPRHVVIETKTPEADTLSPDTLSYLAGRCQTYGVAFHAEPPKEDLGCMSDRCGDCIGYAQHIRFNTPFVAAADTYYFHKDIYQYKEGYWYIWWINRWIAIEEPRYRG
jgi:hypothetical protein